MTQQPNNRVWFITGCSTGFGRHLATAVLAHGDRAVVTARDPRTVEDIVATAPDRALALALDVTDARQIAEAVRAAESRFGHIDVLVNNAGIGYFGSVEASEEDEVRRMFEINLWGLANATRAVLPGMRARRRGHIVNFSSIGGLVGFPAVGFYNATKFAVEGLSEALWKEVSALGIHVTLVEPSGFRTDWAGRSANEVRQEIADYAESAVQFREWLRGNSGKQPGDPVLAAAAVINVVESETPPLRLLLGQFALERAKEKLELLSKDFTAWETTTVGADRPLEEVAA